MTAIYLQKTVHEGLWSRRMALFFVQLLILTVVLHRFGLLATPAALNLFAVSLGGLVLAILVAVIGLVRIWFGGQAGGKEAFAGIGIALVGLAAPLYFLSNFFLLPHLNDIETTPRDPMQVHRAGGPAPGRRQPHRRARPRGRRPRRRRPIPTFAPWSSSGRRPRCSTWCMRR